MVPPPIEDGSEVGRRAGAQDEDGGPALRRGLVALATAAVVSVYAAGYVRTEAAAERFEGEGGRRASSPPPLADTAVTAVGPDGAAFRASAELSASAEA